LKIIHRIFSFLFTLLAFPLSGQTLEFYNQFNIQTYTSISVDRGDNLFIASSTGTIEKYNHDGELLLTYSSGRITPVVNLEAGLTNKIFAFYNDLQQFLILDRFMSPISDLHLPQNLIGYGRNASLAPDNNIWIIDDHDFSLKKYSPHYAEILVSTPFDLILDIDNYNITDIAEYQNRLYISDTSKGLLIFDNLGNYLDTYQIKGLNRLTFYNEYLLVLSGDELQFIHLYNNQNKQIKVSHISKSKEVACGKNSLFFLAPHEVLVYLINP